jgi:4-hydroxythreonine-4-phosphate dehydrogenase
MTSQSPGPATAVTMGEPAGIGTEVTLKAWLHRSIAGLEPFFLTGDIEHVKKTARDLSLPVELIPISNPDQAARTYEKALPVLQVPLAVPAVPGLPDPTNAPTVQKSIKRAVEFVRHGAANAVVTNPIQKSALAAAGFRFSGHTDYLAHLTQSSSAVMMLASRHLRVVPLTVHVSLRNAIESLSPDLIVSTIQVTHAALRQDFGIPCPRIAVAGLNPHAGEEGIFGIEERLILDPALAELRDMGIAVDGPRPADTMFHEAARRSYDVAICMYHDQALIPIKTLDFHGAVNTTLGLPIVRTSPDHGTALDIAGRGVADPSSFIEAIRIAQEIARRRASRS